MTAPAFKPHILVVEDEPAQQEVLRYNLEAEGFKVTTVSDGDTALIHIDEMPPDAIVLDWMLPGVSGIEICRRLRRRSETKSIPIIMLSARGEEFDRVRGLKTGADDYMVKPYSVIELIARLQIQLRRSVPAQIGGVLRFEDIELNTETHKVLRAGAEIKLGPTEFRLLSVMLEHPKRVWSRERLMDRVWAYGTYVDSRTVDVHIGRLRKRLCKFTPKDPVRTVRGAGYTLGT